MDATIAKIHGYETYHYRDNDQTISYCNWVDSNGERGITSGPPTNTHMRSLKARAIREGATIIEPSQ